MGPVNGPEVVRLTHVPQQAWLLLCSLGLLLVGLLLYGLARTGDGSVRPPTRFWAVSFHSVC